MGSTTNFELTFNQAEVRSDGAHTNATPQQPANSGGGGGGAPSGPAGGDLAGTYPNPTLGVIGSATGPLPSSAARVPVVTIDAKGRVTALTDEAINAVPYANITGTPSSLPPNGSAGGDLSGTYPNPNVQAINGQKIASLSNGILTNVGGVPSVIVQPTGAVVGTTDVQTLTNKSIAASEVNSGTLAAAQMPALTGDVTTTAGAVATTLATVNTVTPGSYPSSAARVPTFTVNGKGLVTASADEAINGVPYANITGTPSSLPPNGSAGGDLTGMYPNPTVNLLSAVTSITEKPIGYATGGNVQLRFDLGSYDAIGLTVNASFSPSGSTGLVKGAVQVLDLNNTTGSSLTLTWPASWQLGSGALPTSITAGQSIRVELRSTGTTEAGVLATYDYSPISSATLAGDVTGASGSNTVVKIRGNAVNAGTPSASQGLRWNGSAYAPVYSAYIYPEDFGATATGAAHDDSTAIMNAWAAVGPNQALYLSGTYGIGTSAALSFTSAKGIMCSGTATLVPTTISPATNGLTLTGFNMEGFMTLPNILNFTGGYALQVNIALADIKMGFINNCSIGVELLSSAGFDCLDNDIRAQSIYNCTVAAIQCTQTGTGPFLQGNRVDCNFINSCKRWVYFSAATADIINQNTFSCDAMDMANIGSVTVIHNATGFGQNENNFLVRGFWGGLTGADIWVSGGSANNNLDKCTFDFGDGNANNGSPTSAQQYASFSNPEYSLGWGSTVRCVFGAKQPNNTGIACSATAFARGAFNGGAAIYFNRVLLTAAVPAGGVAAGATFTVYAYHPFVQGNARLAATPSPDSSAPMGVFIDQISDNTATNANEIKIVLRNITGGAIAAGTVIPFLLICGIP